MDMLQDAGYLDIAQLRALDDAERVLSHLSRGNAEGQHARVANGIADLRRAQEAEYVRFLRKQAGHLLRCDVKSLMYKSTSTWDKCRHYGERASAFLVLYATAQDSDDALKQLEFAIRAVQDGEEAHNAHIKAEAPDAAHEASVLGRDTTATNDNAVATASDQLRGAHRSGRARTLAADAAVRGTSEAVAGDS